MNERVDPVASVRAYLAEPRFAVLATVGPDAVPHQVVIHYLLDGDSLIINGRADRRWLLNLRRDERVSILIHDANQPLHWVGLKGRAELLHEGTRAVEDAMSMARRYGEDDTLYTGQRRVSFRVVAEKVVEYGPPA